MRKNEVEVDNFHPNPEIIQKNLNAVKFILASLEVNDLTNIEIWHLKHDIEKLQRDRDYLSHKFKQDKGTSFSSFNVVEEVVSRFLLYYGLDLDQIIDSRRDGDSVTGKLTYDTAGRKYIINRLRQAREEMHKP